MKKPRHDYKVMLEDLPLWEKNPRYIDPENRAKLAKSISDFSETLPGWDRKNGYRLVDPIIFNVQTNRVTGGHQRIIVLMEDLNQNWVHEDDVRYITAPPAVDAELNIALNNPNLAGTYDDWKLYQVLNEDIEDILKTGFEADLIDKLHEKFRPVSLDEILEETDPETGISSPKWLIIRTTPQNLQILEEARKLLESKGLRPRVNYKTEDGEQNGDT